MKWISIKDRLPELEDDGESKLVLCVGFKRSRPDTEQYAVMTLLYNGKWSDEWWCTNQDGFEVHYWCELIKIEPINWK